MKKLISLILTFILLASFTPHTLAADEGFGDNLLLGKTAYTPSPYPNGFGIDKINDGNENSTAATSSTMSQEEIKNGYKYYAMIDLGELYEITRVIIKTRRDLDAGWARIGMRVSVATKSDFSDAQVVAHYVSDLGFKKDLSVAVPNTVARYVIIDNVRNGNTRSWACGEVEAYGEPYSGEGTGDFDDLDTTAQKNAVKTLYNLDIMDGISKTLFGTNNLVTRGEAAQAVCALAGIQEPSGYRNEFLDVTADHKYAAYIQAGVDYGFISKDTHFRPDDYIMGYELIKMVLCINGYYDKPTHAVLYPSKLIQIANEIELLKESGTDGWGKIGRGNMAVILYNTLIANKFELKNGIFEKTEETLLENIFDCQLNTGIVSANGLSGLDEAKETVNLSNVEIANTVYTDASGLGVNFLGERVYYILDKNEDSVIAMWLDEKKNKTVTFEGKDVDDESTLTNIRVYDENNKITRYKVDEYAYTIVNDVAVGGIYAEDLRVENGYVTLLDNNNDGTYDIIKIYRPEIVLVDSAMLDEYSKSLTISNSEGDTYLYNYEYAFVTAASGKMASLDKVASGKLAYVYAGGKSLKIQLMPEGIEAVPSAKTGETIRLDGKDYEMTEYFERMYYEDVEVGKSATFYTDLEGRLVVMADQSQKTTSEMLAVIQKFFVDVNTGEADIRAYTEDAQFGTYQLADEVVFNGDKYNREALAMLPRSNFEGKIVFIRTSADGRIRVITTQDDESGILAKADMQFSETGEIYRGNSGLYYGYEMVIPLVDDVPVFTIPVDANGVPLIGADYQNLYGLKELQTMLSLRHSLNTKGYEFYGMNEYNEPTAVVKKVTYNQATTSYAPLSSHSGTESLMVESIRNNVDEYGELYYTIIGYDIIEGKKITRTLKSGLTKAVDAVGMRQAGLFGNGGANAYTGSTNIIKAEAVPPEFIVDITDINQGDIVNCAKGNYDEYSQLEIALRKTDITPENCGVMYSVGDLPTTIMATKKLQYALVDSVQEGRITYRYNLAKTETIGLDAFTGNLIIFENGKTESYPMSSAGVMLSQNDDIVIYTNGGYHRSIIVWK